MTSQVDTEAPELAFTSSASVAAALSSASGRVKHWLTAGEREIFEAKHLEKRRREWLAGRLVAKDIIARRYQLEGPDRFCAIEILPSADPATRGKPAYRVHGKVGRYDLSISHSGELAVAALGRDAREAVGVDVEAKLLERESVESLLLSREERAELAGLSLPERLRALTLAWVLKEALSKAWQTGLRVALPAIRLNWNPRTGVLADPPFALPGRERARGGIFSIGSAVGAWVGTRRRLSAEARPSLQSS